MLLMPLCLHHVYEWQSLNHMKSVDMMKLP